MIADVNADAGTGIVSELGSGAAFIQTDVTQEKDAQAAIDMALFDIRDDTQLRNCYALGNLQILRAVENLEKANFCDLTGEYVTPAFSAK